MNELGRHALIDAWDADSQLLNDPQFLKQKLIESVEAIGATILTHGDWKFTPQGATVWIILAESHATIHTYPEYNRWMADIFTCGNVDPEEGAHYLVKAIGGEARIKILSRGEQ